MPTDRAQPFRVLYELSRALHRCDNQLPTMTEIIARDGCAITGSVSGCLVIVSGQTGKKARLQEVCVVNRRAVTHDRRAVPDVLFTRGPLGQVYRKSGTVVIHDLAAEAHWLPAAVSWLPPQGSLIGLPLCRDETCFGVLLLAHPQSGAFRDGRATLAEEVAALAAEALAAAVSAQAGASTRYETLFDDAVIPIILTDLDGHVVDVNRQAADLLACDRDDLLHHPIGALHDRLDLADTIGCHSLHELHYEQEIAFRTVITTAQKQEIPVITRVRRLKLGEQDVVEWVEQNITAQMELEQLRRDLSAMVYHDLRGPLQAIGGSIHKLAQVLANHENPIVLNLLQVGVQSTRQLRRMIDSLLDIQRLEDGRTMLNLNPVELRVLLTDAAQLVQPIIYEGGQQLQLSLDDELPSVVIDGDMILRVVINLLENASKYTPNGSAITLSARIDGEHICVSVTDSGPGIPAEMQTRIFDKFNRVKYRNAPQGVGLGLAFCRLAVTAHGGEIWVESEPGQGATFVFTLPVAGIAADDLLSELISTV
jgi:two-component system, NtrC family, sensor histidine kinase KinB